MSASWYERVPAPAVLADIVMIIHALIVGFVVIGLVLTLIGWRCRWNWVRNWWFRGIHLGIVIWVVIQTLRGRYCPLTYWEMDLRSAAGQPTYDTSFIDYWVSRLIYYDFPDWFFMVGYSLFAALVALAWWKYPPRWHRVSSKQR